MKGGCVVVDKEQGCLERGTDLPAEAASHPKGIAEMAVVAGSVVVFTPLLCVLCFGFRDWTLFVPVLISAALMCHTRRVPYATVPGFTIGFVLGMEMSFGTSPAAIGLCGLCIAVFAVPLNAICRGFWRSGAAALLALVAYWCIAPIITDVLF